MFAITFKRLSPVRMYWVREWLYSAAETRGGCRTAFRVSMLGFNFRNFLHMLGDEIAKNQYGMVIGIEALRHEESNIVNTSSEAYNLAVQTHHPKVDIIVDFFH